MRALVLVALLASGCVNSKLVSGIEKPLAVMLPEYRKYVDSDSSLSELDKRVRHRTADQLLNVLEEAKK